MRSRFMTAGFAAAIIGGLLAVPTVSAGWNPVTWFQSLSQNNRVDFLMVTGNYLKPRVLAELAQSKNGQPILLISPTAGGGEELYLMPSESAAMRESKKNFVAFVEFLNPKQVVFIGDSDYMPSEYIELLRNRLPLVIVSGDDWNTNAATLSTVLGVDGITRRFARCMAACERPATPAQPEALIPEPAVTEPVPVPATTPETPMDKKVTVRPAPEPATGK